MENKIKVVGLGPGNLDYLTGAGLKAIKESEIVIGGKRHLEEIESLLNNQGKYTLGKLSDMIYFIDCNKNKKITIVVSGDTGYYSLLTYLRKNLSEEKLITIPGISSFQYLFGRLNMTWEKFSLYSVHGRDCDYIEALKKSDRGIVLLTDGINNPITISENLVKHNFKNIEVIVGERLSYEDEKITRFQVENYREYIKEYEMNVTILKKGD
ncbi:precorrin-6Y C5,15-methyltransferase (decarboxylating) [Cetobacterium ceti]|uniref:Precorrin-6Y C5,15-methyltransferase (Decarboxylating) n=1 Tax=Cetobacterium ceti TaxID=180163 RepID=A0A1T4LD15_9FUSO|nr:precorrin-6y C5,15-methyltransferase (decarboxylating) subunit CbiE [Cetobacterium ceti]SJZ52428.1 precorrin-6Y C5,15-methyltransferase (decarboxylating) [Cetobacterium ceti]